MKRKYCACYKGLGQTVGHVSHSLQHILRDNPYHLGPTPHTLLTFYHDDLSQYLSLALFLFLRDLWVLYVTLGIYLRLPTYRKLPPDE